METYEIFGESLPSNLKGHEMGAVKIIVTFWKMSHPKVAPQLWSGCFPGWGGILKICKSEITCSKCLNTD